MKFPLKIIDKYVIKEFIAPFVLWTLISLFVLLMQTMWLYIDEIMGKGAGLFFITEMIFYLSVFLVPQALLIGVLTASVMVMGSLSEHYELSSMKSAGVSVFRVMLPLLFFCAGIGLFSYVCADILSPLAKLKYNARLYDIRRTKPALAMEEGVFSENIPGYTIRIGKKEQEGRIIKDVMIYQSNRQASGGTFTMSEVIAKDGEMYGSDDEQFMIMKLNEGHRYEKAGNDEKNRFSFIRTSFKSWDKIFEIAQLDRTDERLFGNNQATKTVSRLRHDIDSIGKLIDTRNAENGQIYMANFTTYKYTPQDTAKKAVEIEINKINPSFPAIQSKKQYRITTDTAKVPENQPLAQQLDKPLNQMGSILNSFPVYQKAQMLNKAKSQADNIYNQAKNNENVIKTYLTAEAKHIIELHTKFLTAIMCIVFVFVGAPMGAIVRKGGFGYPVLIAILMFILYIFSYLMFRKLGEQRSVNPLIASWLPCILMCVIGGYLTYHAMRDSRVFKPERFKKVAVFFKILKSKLKR